MTVFFFSQIERITEPEGLNYLFPFTKKKAADSFTFLVLSIATYSQMSN